MPENWKEKKGKDIKAQTNAERRLKIGELHTLGKRTNRGKGVGQSLQQIQVHMAINKQKRMEMMNKTKQSVLLTLSFPRVRVFQRSALLNRPG